MSDVREQLLKRATDGCIQVFNVKRAWNPQTMQPTIALDVAYNLEFASDIKFLDPEANAEEIVGKAFVKALAEAMEKLNTQDVYKRDPKEYSDYIDSLGENLK